MGQAGDFVFRSWPAKPDQLASIRSEARGWLAPLGLSDGSREDLVLAISEAATNAIVHGYPPHAPGRVGVTFWTEPDALCVEVADAGRAGSDRRDGLPADGPSADGRSADGPSADGPSTDGLSMDAVSADGHPNGMGISIMRRVVESVLIRFDPTGTRVTLRHPRGAAGGSGRAEHDNADLDWSRSAPLTRW